MDGTIDGLGRTWPVNRASRQHGAHHVNDSRLRIDRFGHFGFRVKRPHMLLVEARKSANVAFLTVSSLPKLSPISLGTFCPDGGFAAFAHRDQIYGYE